MATEYKIIAGEPKFKKEPAWERAHDDFEALVNEAIKEGWVPLGGVSMLDTRGFYRYAQAMIKESQK